MNILHINTLDSGGAFQVSFRLHQGLLLENFPSKVLVLYQNKHYQEVHPFLKSQNYWQKIKQSIHYKFLRSQHNNLLKNKSAVQFSFTQSPFKLHKHPLVLEADIIHLHWVANFLDYSSFFKQVKKPIVWTLHDMYPFSGGFHYKSYESDEYQILNQEILVQKQEALSQCNNLHIVSPSLWIYKESSASQLLKNFTNYHIPYGLDLNIFKPYLKEGARNYFNIPTNKKIVLFVSEFLQDKRKGLTYLLNALNQFKSDEVLLLTIGNGPIENIDIPNLTLGYLDNPNEMALAYSLADVFVISSLEDNLPNTVLESFACGTPVVGFKVGGIPDMIRDGVNGLLAESKNSQDLAQKIQMLLENDDLRLQMGKNARLIAENEYNLKLQASKYIKLYETIVGKSVS